MGGVWFEWGEFSPEEKSGAKTRSSFAFLSFSFLNLRGKVGFRPGVGIAALEMGFSALGGYCPTPGDSCLAQDSPQWMPWKPGEHNKPALEGQHHSILGKDQGNERKMFISSHTEGRRDPV